MKTCRGCHRDLSLEEFHRNKNLRDGRETKCKTCRSAVAREHRDRYRGYLVAQTRKYQRENREYFREYNRSYRKRKHETIQAGAGVPERD